jgi:ParB/RepB/Spo0J family partition protein
MAFLAHIAIWDLGLKSSDNVRQTVKGLAELASSIREHGLLQNLVVRMLDDGKYVVVAGERRLRAIGVLAESGSTGRVDPHQIPCLVLEGDVDHEAVNVIENTCREAVLPWELGHKYQAILDTGCTQPELSKRVGKSQAHISQHCTIARGIHPALAKRMANANPLSLTQLLGLARLLTNGEPDLALQEAALARYLGAKAPEDKGKAKSERATVWRRYLKLQNGVVKIPAKHLDGVKACMAYLRGEGRVIK